MAADDDAGDDGEESEVSLDRQELKKFLKLARTKEMPFAYCPAPGKEEDCFTSHKTKKPKKLGKMAKDDVEQPKYAFGTMKVEGKIVTLTCDRTIAGMERKMGKYLRKMKVPLQVRIAGADGEEVS